MRRYARILAERPEAVRTASVARPAGMSVARVERQRDGNAMIRLQRAVGNRAMQRLMETAPAIQRQPKAGASTHCDANDPNLDAIAASRSEWENAVKRASAATGGRRDQCFVNLIQSALGKSVAVRGATNSATSFAVATRSYQKFDSAPPVVNFDAHFNRISGVPPNAAGLTREQGDSIFMVFGPKSVSAEFGPDLTRSTLDHENVHVRQFQASSGTAPPEAEMEVEAYAEGFAKWFLRLWRIKRPCNSNTDTHEDMFNFYEDAGKDAQDRAFAVIEKFVRSVSKDPCACWKLTRWFDLLRDRQESSKLGKRMAKELPCIGPIPAGCNPTNPTPCPDQ